MCVSNIFFSTVTACLAVSNIVKSSLGPVGLDKMLVDEIGDVTITNDGATILKQLEVEHPAAKVLVELADRQDKEVGDGTTSVVIIAAELLKRGNQLVSQKIHPTTVISGYRLAMREAIKFIKSHLVVDGDQITREVIVNAAKTSMSSKIINSDANFFAEMVVDAVTLTKKKSSTDTEKYSVSAINVLKVHGRSSLESYLMDGYALNTMYVFIMDFFYEFRIYSFFVPIFVPNKKTIYIYFTIHAISSGDAYIRRGSKNRLS